MSLHIHRGLTYSPIFAGLIFFIITLLAMRTSMLRKKLGIFAGDGGNEDLRRASRAHGTSVEHGVLLGVLLLVLDWQGAPPAAILALGLIALLARLAHPAGMLLREEAISLPGVAATYLCELSLSLWVIINGFRAL